MSQNRSDTIFARASGAGKAGVAVYRVSGPDAHAVSAQLIGRQIKNREAVLTLLRDQSSGAVIDRGLTITFQGPASFTGEDSVEFHLHGSRAVETALYEALHHLGARPAEAGEFTLRALKNGKLDLAQAEALADLIEAETSAQRQQALGQLAGRLSGLAEDWRHRILSVLAPLEADIDFPDEGDVPAAIAGAAGPAISGLKDQLTEFLNQSGRARRIREGVSIAVVGPPNAGKSSLVNALAGSEIAIVSDIAGTTRDVVETRLDLGGIVANLADTAGLRGDTGDLIEKEGVKRALARAETANIRIGVLDPTSPAIDPNAVALLQRSDFLIWSKADLGPVIPTTQVPDGVRVMTLSAKTGLGMAEFLAALTEAVSGGADQSDEPALTRARHVQAVEAAIAALTRAEAHIATAPELAAEDARLAARALGQITGAVGVEDVLGEIFSSFCIGK